jgi:hypothetical protein
VDIIVLGDVEMVFVTFSCSHITACSSSWSMEALSLARGNLLRGAKSRSQMSEVMTFLDACDGGMASAGDGLGGGARCEEKGDGEGPDASSTAGLAGQH